MIAFAQLLEQLYFTNSAKTKSAALRRYLAETPDPDRGWAIAAIAGTLDVDLFKRKLVKKVVTERVDPVLFDLCYDYVGELSETVAHMWPQQSAPDGEELPTLAQVISDFDQRKEAEKESNLVSLLDRMTPSQRWALLKLGTRGLRVGVSARQMKNILAEYGSVDVEEIEAIWHGVTPPYTELLSWLEGKGPKPDVSGILTFVPVMLAQPYNPDNDDDLDGNEWAAEWKFDGIRVQLTGDGEEVKLFTRTGDDISHSFPDLLSDMQIHATLDAELLVFTEDGIGSFNKLQKRLNKKRPSKALMQSLPSGLMLYDVLNIAGTAYQQLAYHERRVLLQEWFAQQANPRFKLSPPVEITSMLALRELKEQRLVEGIGPVEGLMLKRKDSSYVAGRPKHHWYKWKREPQRVDAVMMYAQRGHGKRSSYYSDYTFGLWGQEGLLPIGKAYSGFSDEELKALDRWVRRNTTGRFGPVKEVHKSLVLEVAFDAVQPSTRHKSGMALRFPRIKRIRWDKPASEADTIESLKALIVA